MRSQLFLDFNSEEVDQTIKDAFWGAVEDCLVEIHKLRRPVAHHKREELRKRIESPPPGISSVLIYHAEPFYVACDIAGNQLDLSYYRPKYDAILSRHNW